MRVCSGYALGYAVEVCSRVPFFPFFLFFFVCSFFFVPPFFFLFFRFFMFFSPVFSVFS